MYIVSVENKRNDHRLDLTLPLSENELDRQLTADGFEQHSDVKINSVDHTNGLITLPDGLKQADIFELNLLLTKLEKYDEYVLEDFSSAMSAFKISSPKGLVNLTFDLEADKYVFCRTAGNHEELAGWFMEDEGGFVSHWVEDNLNYEALGRDLDKYEYKGAFSDNCGYVYLPKQNECDHVYDGLHLPPLSSKDGFSTTLCYENENGLRAFISLPAGPLMWQELYRQIGSDTSFTLTNGEVLGQWVQFGENTDVDKLNSLCEQIASLDDSHRRKLKSVFEYAVRAFDDGEDIFSKYGANGNGCHERLKAMYDHIDDFDLIPNVANEAGLAWRLVQDKYPNFDADESLWSYINYDRLGQDWHESVKGRFTSGGYVIDETPPEQTLTEGEMQL